MIAMEAAPLAEQIFKAIEKLQTNNHLGIKTSDPEIRVLPKGSFPIFYEL